MLMNAAPKDDGVSDSHLTGEQICSGASISAHKQAICDNLF
jgi:hypothetical protein